MYLFTRLIEEMDLALDNTILYIEHQNKMYAIYNVYIIPTTMYRTLIYKEGIE